jgi:hypothetical protein
MHTWRALLVIAGLWRTNAEPVTLPIVVFNRASVPPGILAQAQTYYSAVLESAGIDIEWAHAAVENREVRVNASALLIYLLSGQEAKRIQNRTNGCLGLALVGSAAGQPVYSALISYDQIKQTAEGRPSRLPLILGHVMAHETGHLLLGNAHAVSGIMKPSWTAGELLEINQGRAAFTRGESGRMRTELLARHKPVRVPQPK